MRPYTGRGLRLQVRAYAGRQWKRAARLHYRQRDCKRNCKQMFAAGDWVEIGWVSRAADFRYEIALSATQAPLVRMRRHGLENRWLPRLTRGFESHPLRHLLDASLTLRTARTISVVST